MKRDTSVERRPREMTLKAQSLQCDEPEIFLNFFQEKESEQNRFLKVFPQLSHTKLT